MQNHNEWTRLYQWTLLFETEEKCREEFILLEHRVSSKLRLDKDPNHRIYTENGHTIALNIPEWDYRRRGRILQIYLAANSGNDELLAHLRQEYGKASMMENIHKNMPLTTLL